LEKRSKRKAVTIKREWSGALGKCPSIGGTEGGGKIAKVREEKAKVGIYVTIRVRRINGQWRKRPSG